MKALLSRPLVACSLVFLVAAPALAQSDAMPKAFIDPAGPGWKPLTLEDFDNANGDKDTWTGSGPHIHSTGVPVGVARSKKQYTNFELVAEWRHLKSGGN